VDAEAGELKGIQDQINDLQDQGYCVLRQQLARPLINACRDAFWPVLLAYLKNHGHEPNRGPHRHFLPMPFEPPCFVPEFFFDPEVLAIVRSVLDDRAVADQWGCDGDASDVVEQELRQQVGKGPAKIADDVDLPLSPQSKNVLRLAAESARGASHRQVPYLICLLVLFASNALSHHRFFKKHRDNTDRE
jgi:hypothetical protein